MVGRVPLSWGWEGGISPHKGEGEHECTTGVGPGRWRKNLRPVSGEEKNRYQYAGGEDIGGGGGTKKHMLSSFLVLLREPHRPAPVSSRSTSSSQRGGR